MGILSGLLGNASKVDIADVEEEFSKVLAPNEKVEQAYKLVRDYLVFTDKRLVLVNKQGVTGSKIEFHSIPYKSVTHFSIETAGHLDLESELTIWISSTNDPVKKTFNKNSNVYEIQAVLASHIAK